MQELDVRIVRLEPLRVASTRGFGPDPEARAWRALLSWAKPIGLLDRPARFFGYNNPHPSPGNPNYGYEQWMTVGPEVSGGDGVAIKDFPGGLFAVTRCEHLEDITRIWQQLMTWRENSPYRLGADQCLEECLDPLTSRPEDSAFDLYLSILGPC
jgi:DNA gyrase inhibitor GyrI